MDAFHELASSREPRVGQEAGGASRDRTGDLLLAKQALSQLSYGPSFTGENRRDDFRGHYSESRRQKRGFCRPRRRESPVMVGLGGVAPPTSPLSGVRSN